MGLGLIPSALGGLMMGLGYTSGAYAGYGGWNTADPYGIHNKKNSPQTIRMAYGMSGYGSYRRRYRYRRPYYRRYGRRSSYYNRRSYYRRRYY